MVPGGEGLQRGRGGEVVATHTGRDMSNPEHQYHNSQELVMCTMEILFWQKTLFIIEN